MWAVLFRRLPKLPKMKRERLELADGDFIDVDISDGIGQSTVLLLHGLEGSIDSHYIRGLAHQLIEQGRRVAVMHFRSCSGENNRLARSYHSGVSEDLQLVLELLACKAIIIDSIVGYSLGGNVLLKWLGEQHKNHQVKAAVAVCAPLLLNECADAIEKGFSKFYLARLLSSLKVKAKQKKRMFPASLAIGAAEIRQISTFWEFDELVTAPLHGFAGATDYYDRVSGQQFLKAIQLPTLIIHAKDDPFMNTNVIPAPNQLSAKVRFELADYGGHVGFVSGQFPWNARYYLEERIPEFLNSHQTI